MEITISRNAELKSKPDDNSLGFGTLFTDYMFNIIKLRALVSWWQKLLV